MRTFSRSLPRTAFAVLGAAGLLAVGACAEDDTRLGVTEDTEDTVTVGDTEGDTDNGGATTGESTAADAGDAGGTVAATLNDAEGTELGTVEISEVDDALQFSADLTGLEPGFHGFHVHQTGLCETGSQAPGNPGETGDFLSAGGHLGAGESDHPDHAGDLPQLLVKNSGDAVLSFETDRLTMSDLEDEDGSAIMIHSGPDNYANVPGRYAPGGPDGDSLNAGDAGSRLACGVIGG